MPPSSRSPQPAKALLALRDLRQADVARSLDVSPHWLGRCLNGRERPSADIVRRLAELLGVPEPGLFVDDADDVVVQLVRRTAAASGVPERLEDVAAAEMVAAVLRGTG